LLDAVSTIQDAALEAAHVQSRLVVTVRVPEPPAAGAVSIEFATVTRHFEPVGPVTESSEELHATVTNSRVPRLNRAT
jgi:hypothetical protein